MTDTRRWPPSIRACTRCRSAHRCGHVERQSRRAIPHVQPQQPAVGHPPTSRHTRTTREPIPQDARRRRRRPTPVARVALPQTGIRIPSGAAVDRPCLPADFLRSKRHTQSRFGDNAADPRPLGWPSPATVGGSPGSGLVPASVRQVSSPSSDGTLRPSGDKSHCTGGAHQFDPATRRFLVLSHDTRLVRALPMPTNVCGGSDHVGKNWVSLLFSPLTALAPVEVRPSFSPINTNRWPS